VNAGELRPSFLITHRYGRNEAIEALSALCGNVRESEPRGKVVITL
jgi:hypothetical protein